MGRSPLLLITTLAAALVAAAPAAAADPALLNPVFQDGAVLQQGRALPVWGEATPAARITVRLGGASVQAVADAAGRWRADLPAAAPAERATLSVETTAGWRQAVEVAVGEVWLCSGQSNMELPVRLAADADREIAVQADPALRLLYVSHRPAATPQTNLQPQDRWRIAGPDSVSGFSAACLAFGRALRTSTGRSVGLIAAAWNGSVARAWTSPEGLRRLGGYDEMLATAAAADPLAAFHAAQDAWWAKVDPGSRAAAWADPNLSDSGWKAIDAPGPWEKQGMAELAEFDGALWLRATLVLDAKQAALAGMLHLGGVDDADTTWVNGREIGRGVGGTRPRDYPVPAGTLRPGVNVIAVRVLDTGGGGGLTGPAAAMRLTLADGREIPLLRKWKYRRGPDLDALVPVPLSPADGAKNVAGLFNGMIAPLTPYALAGVAWYQGESDVGEGLGYRRLLENLIADWRRAFAQPLPFLVVQISVLGPLQATPHRSKWAEVREAQRLALAADPTTALIVTTDIGDRANIHPANKQEVGRRLALAARRLVYKEDVHDRGPAPASAARAGDAVAVRFEGAPLALGAAGAVGFQLCDAARCDYAAATMADGTARLLIPRGFRPTRVRYCWDDSPVCNLFDGQGLPATPFQLDIQP